MHYKARTRTSTHFRMWMNAGIAVIFMSMSGIASAGMHLSLSGSQSTSNIGYQKLQSGLATGAIDFDIWDYLRLGYTYRQEIAATGGYTEAKNTDGTLKNDGTYVKFLNRTRSISQSVDLTIVLYAGDVFMPYIFGGAGKKTYEIVNQMEGQEEEHYKPDVPPFVPNGGFGLGMRISQKFSVKFSQTYTPGVKALPGMAPESTLDAYTQVGISYAL